MGNVFQKIKIYFFENKKSDYAFDIAYKNLDFFDIDTRMKTPIETHV
jgi:hypothetical protein